ncbi:MAG TPA: LysM peptidoglycan-binding domain-containing protein [Longimicrobium sp.]|nr:LysM peptidoglycan-binding domain-containing protein [Longimicrobium sp.]
MRIRRALPMLLAALALLSPAAARAQRDTIRLGGTPEPRDTVTLSVDDTTPERPARWSQPFAVEGSGEVAPRPAARQIVWLPADSVRARRIAARRAAAGEDSTGLAAADSSGDDADAADSAPPPARRAGSRTASRDSATTGRRSTRATRADTASTRRSASRGDDDDADADARPTRRASAGRDTTASMRRTASRDTATTRRSSSRDTASTRRTASRDTAAARRASSTRPRTHTVAAGETLFGIARRYGVTSAQIRALNTDLGETLEIGTVLRLPAGARAPAQPAPRAAADRDTGDERPSTRRATADADDDERPAARRTTAARAETPRPAAGRARRHTVAAGETLFGIARKYGVTVDAIRRANRLESDTVRPGQALAIPAAAPPQR